MFYADYGFHAYVPRISHYILRFVGHYDEYAGSVFVRSVSYDDIVWC